MHLLSLTLLDNKKVKRILQLKAKGAKRAKMAFFSHILTFN